MTGVITPFGLWFFFGWAILAGFVLRQTWQPVRVEDDSPGLRGRIEQRLPRLGASIPVRGVAIAALGSTTLMVGYGWISGDTMARFGIVIAFTVLGVIALLLWLTDA